MRVFQRLSFGPGHEENDEDRRNWKLDAKMASSKEAHVVKTCERIAEQVQQLAEAIAAPSNSAGTSNSAALGEGIEEEVSRVFGRPPPTTAVEQQNLQLLRDRGRARGPRGVGGAPVFTLRRNFGRSKSSSSVRPGKKPKVSEYGPFERDTFLLSGPHVTKVPHQGGCAWLIENGYQLTGVKLRKEWNEVQILAEIKEAFNEKLPGDVNFEILMSCYNKLVKPSLAPEHNGLSGIMVNKIFKDNKPLYIQPDKNLFFDPYNPVSFITLIFLSQTNNLH